ncbi:uncharacterized protein K452DRAFT_78163 [Aplosporella prunicola CBS 121167]|uniref:Polysaccharide biosynthesis protein C-terminal domain-containing protein n=1 Tax=Aplosporella prunicola CBS 121167 TaxID=1176127 RepID=A0A6A6B6R5_9PEZI|nr:uncharacterized protein K452DRAFT_78163 [Aplosporella prunicola CBS 121167]KAF2138924.1 hypothetical protein K452DRAFT_78163 [Aplosporella prunicola CBS 121167]
MEPPPVSTYAGAALFNAAAFALPALYATLSKLWVARIDDASLVATIHAYTYMGAVAAALNDGLPRAAWLVIGDRAGRGLRERLGLAHTLVAAQAVLGAAVSVVLVAAARAFVPHHAHAASVAYARLSACSALAAAVEVAVAAGSRALDRPDVPLVSSGARVALNALLDLVLLSRFRVGAREPTVALQAAVRLACDVGAGLVGLAYFLLGNVRALRRMNKAAAAQHVTTSGRGVSLAALKVLARPGALTFLESAVRNALGLWLVSKMAAMGADYATAWGVFKTMRQGLVMVPVQALEATSLALVGHEWGAWRVGVGVGVGKRQPRAATRDVARIVRPAFVACLVLLLFEVALCVALAEAGARRFALYLSASEEAARIAAKMWRTIDWTYILYALHTQLATILLATTPLLYLAHSLVASFCWTLPWLVAVTRIPIPPADAWPYRSAMVGGALVFGFVDVAVFVGLWTWLLREGKLRLRALRR